MAQTRPYSQLQFSHSFNTKTAGLATHAGQEVLSTLLANLVLFWSLEMHHLPSPVITLSVSPIYTSSRSKDFCLYLNGTVVNFDLPPSLIDYNCQALSLVTLILRATISWIYLNQ